MNRTKVNKLIMTILMVILLLIITLYSAGTISHDAVVILGLSIICAYALTYHLNSSASKTKEDIESEKTERRFKKTKVQRTREGNLFELITALILICSLVIGIATQTIESGSSIWNGYAFCFIGAIAGLILAYYPLFIWSPSSVHVSNEEQFKLLIRKHRVVAVESALLALMLSISPVDSHMRQLIICYLIFIWLGTDLLFSFLHRKNH